MSPSSSGLRSKTSKKVAWSSWDMSVELQCTTYCCIISTALRTWHIRICSFCCIFCRSDSVLAVGLELNVMMMNNECERILKEAVVAKKTSIPKFVWIDWGNPRKASVRILDAPTDNQTEYLQNKNLECHRYANPLRKLLACFVSRFVQSLNKHNIVNPSTANYFCTQVTSPAVSWCVQTAQNIRGELNWLISLLTEGSNVY
jgi:hypothetical protein